MRRFFTKKDSKQPQPLAQSPSSSLAGPPAADTLPATGSTTLLSQSKISKSAALSLKTRADASKSSLDPSLLPSRGTPTASTTSSSSASSTLKTPVDDPFSNENLSSKKSWPSWMGSLRRRKQASSPQRASAAISKGPRSRNPDDTTSDEEDQDEDDEDDDDDDKSSISDTASPAPQFPSPSRVRPHRYQPSPPSPESAKAIANLHAITVNSLQPIHTTPPLVQSQSSPQFPRSTNPMSHFPPVAPMRVEILKKRLMKRLEVRDLDNREQLSILSFSQRPPTKKRPMRRLSNTEDAYAASKAVGGGWSKGMKRWATRSCFEERVVVWVIASDTLVQCPVSRISQLGIAELEFSEGAEALAGLHRQNELPPPPADIYVPAANRKLPPPLVVPRRNRVLSSRGHEPFKVQGSSNYRKTTLSNSSSQDPADDDLPLGVVLERKRRGTLGEEGRPKEDSKKVYQKPVEVARQTRDREREKAAKTEEAQKKKYAEHVAATRARREQGRSGQPIKDAWREGVETTAPAYIPSIRKTSEASKASSVGHGEADSQRKRQTLPSAWTDMAAGQWAMPMVTPPTMVATPMGQLPPGWNGPFTAPLAGTFPYGASADPAQLAALDQSLQAWVYREAVTASMNSLHPPRFPSSGGSSGSLTPPRFPHSRPSSFTSSSEDVHGRTSRSPSRAPASERSRRSSREPSGSNSNRGSVIGSSSFRGEPSEGARSTSGKGVGSRPRGASSTRTDASGKISSGGSRTHDYTPTSSSRLARPGNNVLPVSASTDAVHRSARPTVSHSASVPAPSRYRASTVGENMLRKREDVQQQPQKPQSSSQRDRGDGAMNMNQRTLPSHASLWNMGDSFRSRTVAS